MVFGLRKKFVYIKRCQIFFKINNFNKRFYMLDKIKSTPLVSVVIPCYNHSCYVEEAIQSVIDQDYENIELIIIDDGSSDDSVSKIGRMLSACQQRFKRFEFISRPNKGLCATLNESLEWCQGEFFSAVASDDVWLPHKINKQVELFLSPGNENVGVISGEMVIMNFKGVAELKSKFQPLKVVFYNFLDVYHARARINAPAAMIRTQCVRDAGGYNVNVIIEDLYMWLSITSLGYSVMAVSEIFSKYRIHNSNTFSKIEEMQESRIKLLKHFSPSENDLSVMIQHYNLENFKAAAIYQKKYAIKLFVLGKINPFNKGVILYIFALFVPKNILFKSVSVFRYFRLFFARNI